MDLAARLDLGDLHLRTLLPDDTALLVEATRNEQAPALWGPRPAGPYSVNHASTALQHWDPARGKQASYGVLRADRLVAALGLMLDRPHSAELAYWVPPEERRHGIGLRSVRALTAWAHQGGGLRRLWLEIEPGNTASWHWHAAPATSWNSAWPSTAVPGLRTIQIATSGMTASSSYIPCRPYTSDKARSW